MTPFYLDIIQIGGTFKTDTVGVDLVDALAAREVAKLCLAETSEGAVNQDLPELRIQVRDLSGSRVTIRAACFEEDDVDVQSINIGRAFPAAKAAIYDAQGVAIALGTLTSFPMPFAILALPGACRTTSISGTRLAISE